MFSRVVVGPSSSGAVCGGRGVHRAFGNGFADERIFSGVGGVFLQAPPLVVVVLIAFGSLCVGPDSAFQCAVGGVGGQERRSGGEEFPAASTSPVGATGDDAIVVFVLSRIDVRHDHGFFFGHEVLTILVVFVVQQHGVSGHAELEVRPVFAFRRCPTSLGDCEESGQCEPFHVVSVADVFTPESGLHAVVCGCGNGLVVGFLHVVSSVAGSGRVLCRVALFAVDVVGSPGRVDVFQSELLRFCGGSFGSCPAIDECVGGFHGFRVRISGCDGFVPDGEFASFGLHEVRHFFDEVTLELTVVCQAEFSILCLAECVAFPSRGRAFVATDVNDFVGEDFDEFSENVFCKLYGFGISHVHDV